MCGMALLSDLQSKATHEIGTPVATAPVVAAFGLVFAFGFWLVALVPLYFFVKRDSALWSWPACTFCGAALPFAMLMLLVLTLSPRDVFRAFLDGETLLILVATAVPCGASALFASVTAHLFVGPRPSPGETF